MLVRTRTTFAQIDPPWDVDGAFVSPLSVAGRSRNSGLSLSSSQLAPFHSVTLLSVAVTLSL